jgi:putative restriction endonuclease
MSKSVSLSSVDPRAQFHALRTWGEDGVRIPYKPLLLLYALGRCAGGRARLMEFEKIEQDLTRIFREFGPPGAVCDPASLFWDLRNDGVWEVSGGGDGSVRAGKAMKPTRARLIADRTTGGLTPGLFAALSIDAPLLRDIAGDLLEAHFPGTLHAEIMAAVQLDPALGVPPSRRDPKFTKVILKAYEGRCAVCALGSGVGGESQGGLEAAYIQWHQAGGPATVCNGLALCGLHQKLFDRGAFTLTEDRRVMVSEALHGSPTTEKWITRFHGHTLRVPRRPADRPDPGFITWHRREVFREPGRPLA